MQLTEEDKRLLRKIGYRKKDFPQIEKAMQTKYTKYDYRHKRISRAKAIELLGREKFIYGLSRSAFHWSACQITSEGEEVGFDSCRLFK